jgi:hypothetical protein
MDASTWRPIVSGLIGAVVSLWLGRRWAKTLPETFASKSIEQIRFENRAAVSIANAMFFVGLCIGLAMYKIGGYSNNDMAPLAIGFGFAGVMPVVVLAVTATFTRRNVSEAFAAFSIGQGTPMWATYGSLALFSFIAIAGVIKLVT